MTSHRDSVVEFASFSSRQSPRTEFAAMSSAPSVVLKGNVSADISIAHVRTSVAADHTLDPFSNTTCPTHPKAPLWRRSPRTVQTTQDPRTHEKQYISSKIQSELRKESALAEIDDFEFHAGLRKEISPRKAKIEQLCLLKDGVQRNEVDYDAIDPRTEARYERWKKEARIIQHASKGYYTHRANIQSSHHPQTSPSREDRNSKALGVRSKSCLSMETAVSRDGVSVESPISAFHMLGVVIREGRHHQERQEYADQQRLQQLEAMRAKMQSKREDALRRGEYYARRKAWGGNVVPKPRKAESKNRVCTGHEDEDDGSKFTLQEEIYQLDDFARRIENS